MARAASTDSAARPITLAISALGGQGGGVLADWIVAMAEAHGIMLAPGTVFRPHLERSPWMRFNVTACEDTRVQRWLQRQATGKTA